MDLQNYYSKEPDFQIGITEEACNYLIESSPDTKNMKFFPKSLMNDIETTIGNELHSVENIKGFYPIVGKNGKENIKILIDGDKISTVIQTVSIGEQEELKDFIQKNDKLVNWEQFQNNHGTIVLHDHRMSDYIAGEVQDYIGTEMEFYDLVPVGTEMSSLVPEKLVNCGYLDITEDDFPEMKLCWDGKNINILLVTETTYDWLVEKLTPQIFEIQFNVDKNQESVIRERLNQMIRNYNMEFQSKYGHADKLNLFYLDSKSERLLKEQNYIQTSRWLLMSISEILIFIGIMNFANTRISDIMLRQWECKILERVGMTKKQEYRMFVTEGLFYWLLLCGLLMSFGNLGIGIMQWYMKMQISYFAFRYPVKEMIALMVFLLLCSIIFPGIIYKKLKKKMAQLNFGGVTENVMTREEFPLEKAREILKDETIAVIGYGVQGPGQACNLRDNGFNVIVGQRPGKTYEKAIADGWVPGETLFGIEEACEKGTIIMCLLSDAAVMSVWPTIKPYLTPGKALYFSHGFAITWNDRTGVVPQKDIDVIMVAPKGSGTSLRTMFLEGRGLNSSYAIYQDATGKAMDRTIALGIGIGSGYLFETTFQREATSDLTGERGSLMGAIQGLLLAQYEVLRENGHTPSEAFNETVEELTQSLMPLFAKNGMDWMYANCSTTAQRGALDWMTPFHDAIKPVVQKLYASVKSGNEAQISIDSNSQPDYREKLNEELRQLRESEMWQTAVTVRQLRPENN